MRDGHTHECRDCGGTALCESFAHFECDGWPGGNYGCQDFNCPGKLDYPFELDTGWRELAPRCQCGEPLRGEIAEVVRDERHVLVHQGCMLEDEEVA